MKLVDTLDLLVNKSILSAQRGVPHYLVENCDLFIVFHAILVVLMNNFEVAVLALHPLVDLR